MSALRCSARHFLSLSEQDFMATDMVVQVGVQPCRIDITTGIDGIGLMRLGEQDGYHSRRIDLFVPSKADLLKNKVASVEIRIKVMLLG
jgi:hypothetical protein